MVLSNAVTSRSCRFVAPRVLTRSLSFAAAIEMPLFTDDYDPEEWTRLFSAEAEKVRSDVSHYESANIMKALTRTNLLRATDIRDDPERFFEAHRILAQRTVEHGPGFWIRFTVHYNLFCGTILAVGTDEQVDDLTDFQAEGKLGCFSLTEKLAGVLSGFLVDTTATYDSKRGGFLIDSPTAGSRKNWISQGFTADKTVVLADLILESGESKGPHAFVMELRGQPDEGDDESSGMERLGKLVPNVTCSDMGMKTVGNDLDNAAIRFENAFVPRGALLSRFGEVGPSGEYRVKGGGVGSAFEMIGQRLFTGRVCVAQAALEYRRALFARTKGYCDEKRMAPSPGESSSSSSSSSGGRVLGDLPQLKKLFADDAARLRQLDAFCAACERELCQVLKEGGLPSASLADAIATAKVIAVEDSIERVHRLKQDVGSYALMADSYFQNTDFLQCCKFAEGDSRILMQKLARDRFRRFAKGATASGSSDAANSPEEEEACAAVAAKMKAHGGTSFEAWEGAWEEVYDLASAVMERIMQERVGGDIGEVHTK